MSSQDVSEQDTGKLSARDKVVERRRAIQAYAKLNAAALRLLRPRGVLVAASCSAHVGEEEFFGAVLTVARASGRRFEEIETTSHAPDHPATFPEARYLKCLFLRAG